MNTHSKIDIDRSELEWQQYYPTYTFKNSDILLKEYEVASNNVLSQERVFINAANILLILATIIGSALAAYFQFKPPISEIISLRSLFVILLLLICFSWFTTRYFAERQKSIIFDSRKIVVIRKMLGLDYGTQQMVLPNWRLEGASNPFAIKIFPGWLTSTAYPFWILVLSTVSILLFLLPPFFVSLNLYIVDRLNFIVFNIALREQLLTFIFCILWSFFLAISFRRALFDSNETLLLLFAVGLSRFLRVRLVDSFEYLIYRAKLAHYELVRLKLDVSPIKLFLIRLEDRSFYQNHGISLRGILRAIHDYVSRGKVSGASTLTQQLVRSLFIVDYQKTIRRKIVEIILALWANQKLPKEDIMNMYVQAVRYEKGVFGIVQAFKYFFPKSKIKIITPAQAFFLAERISNIRSKLLLDRIRILIRDVKNAQLLSSADIMDLKSIYYRQVDEGRIIVTDKVVFDKWIKEGPVA